METYIRVVVALLMVCCMASCGPSYTPLEGWQKHENYTHKFTVYYPPGWKLSNQGNPNLVFYVSSPRTSDHDHIQENVNLIAQLVAEGTLLGTYIEELEKKAEGQLQNVKKVSTEEVEFKGFDALHGVYQAEVNEIRVKWEQYAWLRNGYVFILTYSADISQYDAYKEPAMEIVESLQFY